MKAVLPVFVALAKEWMRSKSGVVFSFLFPLMLLLVFGAIFSGGDVQYPLEVQNLDVENGHASDLSELFVDMLENSGVFDIEEIPTDVNAASWVAEHPSFNSHRVLIIPENFGQNAKTRGVQTSVSTTINTLELVVENLIGENQQQTIKDTAAALENLLSALSSENATLVLLLEEGDQSAQAVYGGITYVAQTFNSFLVGSGPVVEVEVGTLGGQHLKAVDYYLPGYVAAFIMTNGVLGVTAAISESRRRGIVKLMASSPLPKSSWIVANLLLQVVLAFFLLLVMLAAGHLVFSTTATLNAVSLILIFLGATAFCGLGITIGSLVKDVEAASALGNMIAFPMMFLSGAFWPIEIMPGALQAVARGMPLFYFHQGLRQAMVMNAPEGTVVPIIVLGVLTVVFLGLAIKVTKWREL